jgi:glycosyltransferase involved in cell wall biosynthesis
VGLAARIRMLYENPELRERIAAQAARTASQYTWDRNGVEMRAIFADALERKRAIPPEMIVNRATSRGPAGK